MGGGKHVNPYYLGFVKKSLRENLPYDEFVRRLITANGQAWENGAVGYTFRDNGMPLDHLANTVRIFLGTRLECAQCHDHPFDKWTQMEFYQMAAFSYGMRPDSRSSVPGLDEALDILRKETPDRAHYANLRRASTDIMGPLRSEKTTVIYNPGEQLTLPHDYQYEDAKPRSPVRPAVMFGSTTQPNIESYAKWMTSPDNPRFTVVIANRLWKQAMGLGFIEPVDELRDTTQSHIPGLSEYLARLMVGLDYDMRAFLAALFNSQAYLSQATLTEPHPEEFYHFPGPILRRMTAEQTWDSVVTLINPHTEGGDWKLAQQTQVREARQLMMLEAINKYTGKRTHRMDQKSPGDAPGQQ